MLKPFQKQDLARAALTDNLILAWDTGCGKTWAGYTFGLLKCGFHAEEKDTETRRHGESARESVALCAGAFASPARRFPDSPFQIFPNAPVLIVAPGDLHDQWIKEGADHFRVHVTRLDSQATFLRLSSLSPIRRFADSPIRTLPPGFYITSYTELGHNGVRSLPKADKIKTREELTAALAFVGQTWQDVRLFHLAKERNGDSIRPLAGSPIPRFPDSTSFESLNSIEQLHVGRQCLAARIAVVGNNVGEWAPVDQSAIRYQQSAISNQLSAISRIKCVWDPTLADLCADSFRCVIVDEATKLKGGFDTQIAAGVLQLNPDYRLVCTATPIKNRLPNVFPLAWWACGGRPEAHSRWPYAIDDQLDFAKTFCVTERNLTKEREVSGSVGKRVGGSSPTHSRTRSHTHRFSKLTPQVCNVHKVWKLLAPIVLRRRKKDIGEQIVGKSRQVYRVPMGTRQAFVYKQHLEWQPVDRNGLPAIGPKLQALRMAAAAPHSPLLPQARGPAYCPKMAATLTLIEQTLRARKQVIVFSPFHDPLDELARRLRDAGVAHALLDGRTSQKKRGEIAGRFKLGRDDRAVSGYVSERVSGTEPTHSLTHPLTRSLTHPLTRSPTHPFTFPILLAGTECMAEGHSFPNCSVVIQYAYPWALDKVLQSEDRAHRLNSVEDLQVYRLITEGSIDKKMESQIDEKADAAELVLDGHLLGENAAEVNLAELLEIAVKEFDESSRTIDEAVLEVEWPGLRDKLRAAFDVWKTPAPANFKSEISNFKPPAAPVTVHSWRTYWRTMRQQQAELVVA